MSQTCLLGLSVLKRSQLGASCPCLVVFGARMGDEREEVLLTMLPSIKDPAVLVEMVEALGLNVRVDERLDRKCLYQKICFYVTTD